MKQLKKWLTAGLAFLLLVSTAGCEQSRVAGVDLDPEAISEMSPEEKQELAAYFEDLAKTLREESGLPAAEPAEEKPEASDEKTETAVEATPEPEETAETAVSEDAKFFELNENGHADVTLSELIEHYRGVSDEAMNEIIAKLDRYDQEYKSDKHPEESVVVLYHQLTDAFEYEEAQESVGSLLFDQDTTDKERGEQAAADSAAIELLRNRGRLAVKRVLEGPYGDALKEEMDPAQVDVYLGTMEMSERAEELTEENSRLEVQYKTAMNENITVTHEGTDYTAEQIKNGDVPAELLDTLKNLMKEAYAESVYPIYHDKIANRNEFAKEFGYDNYAEYAYKVIYGRDYTPQDILTLTDSIFETVSELMVATMFSAGSLDLSAIPYSTDNETMFKTLQTQLKTISPMFDEPMEYLLANELYSLGDETNRAEGAYLSPMPATRSGFIYSKRSNSAQDYETITHEFGHFNNVYQTYTPSLGLTQKLDILEIHSQGLEMIASSTLPNVFPDVKGNFSAMIAFDLLGAVTSALMVASFEIKCYENPDMTLEEMNQEFGRLMNVAMLGGNADNTQPNSTWASIHHLFSSPLYYSAYSISALSALDIFAEYLVDPKTGIEKYEKLAKINPNTSYVEAMKEVGLRDMTKISGIKEVNDQLAEYFTGVLVDSLTLENLTDFFGHLLDSASSETTEPDE